MCFRENENCCFNKNRKPAFLAQLCCARVFSIFFYFQFVDILHILHILWPLVFCWNLGCATRYDQWQQLQRRLAVSFERLSDWYTILFLNRIIFTNGALNYLPQEIWQFIKEWWFFINLTRVFDLESKIKLPIFSRKEIEPLSIESDQH